MDLPTQLDESLPSALYRDSGEWRETDPESSAHSDAGECNEQQRRETVKRGDNVCIQNRERGSRGSEECKWGAPPKCWRKIIREGGKRPEGAISRRSDAHGLYHKVTYAIVLVHLLALPLLTCTPTPLWGADPVLLKPLHIQNGAWTPRWAGGSSRSSTLGCKMLSGERARFWTDLMFSAGDGFLQLRHMCI